MQSSLECQLPVWDFTGPVLSVLRLYTINLLNQVMTVLQMVSMYRAETPSISIRTMESDYGGPPWRAGRVHQPGLLTL